MKINSSILFTLGIILLASASRLLPHPDNFTPIMAAGLFGGATFKNKSLAFLVPLFSMFMSDLFLGFHDTMWAVYVSVMISVLIGLGIQNRISIISVGFSSVLGSVCFWIITNFACWLQSNGYYSLDLTGFLACYNSAIPFFQNSLLGDLFFNTILFGAFYLVYQKAFSLEKAVK